MDILTILGLAVTFFSIIGSIILGGDPEAFINIPSIVVITFGVIGSTMIKWPFAIIKSTFNMSIKSLFSSVIDLQKTISEINELATVARKESILALEKIEVKDPFLKKAISLAADNRPPDVIKSILQLEANTIIEDQKQNHSVIQNIADDGPAFGMIGTLIGLVIMLGNLSDQAAIGPAMAVALLTTFYGSFIANVLANPIKNKMSVHFQKENIKMNIIIMGTLGIITGENPRLIEEKLNSFISSRERRIERRVKNDE